MSKSVLAATAIVMALSAAAFAGSAMATIATAPLPTTIQTKAPAQKTGVFCGPYGCGPIWPGPRRWESGWGPWGYAYRPACPFDYYYACKRDPLGYGQCACWPYWTK
jgi:hypothetical protein